MYVFTPMMADKNINQKPLTIGDVWSVYKIPIILGSISLLCIAISLTLLFKSYQTAAPIEFSSPAEVLTKESTLSAVLGITFDIEGAVVQPGVYQLPLGSRIEDAIGVSGGLSREADMDRIAASINRAAKITDGAKIYIPKIGDSQNSTVFISTANTDKAALTSGLININTATTTQLESLPGVGPVTAKKIIDNRPYQTIEELVAKKALGQSLFDKLKDQMTL